MTRFVVLDDDPTGTQEVGGVTAILSWEPRVMAAAVDARHQTIHVVTNSRALGAVDAEHVTAAAVQSARSHSPGCQIILRGDSTLRGHVFEEYRAVCQVTDSGPAPLLLVPALPSAGRLTIDGMHTIERHGAQVPVHETHFAQDGVFTYRSARLREWADERSDGFFAAARGIEIHLAELRTRGPAAVVDALSRLQSGGPGVCVPDAETLDDVQIVADGLHRAREAGLPVVVRASPTFAGAYCQTLSPNVVSPPPEGGPVLVVCGSYIENSTVQLNALCRTFGVAPVELDLEGVAVGHGEPAISAAARAIDADLAAGQLAVLMTPRRRSSHMTDLRAGAQVIQALAACVSRLEPKPATIVAKGGITSYEIARLGLGVKLAEVRGPIAQGVSLWRCAPGGRDLNYVVFPGNIGNERHLSDVVEALLNPARATTIDHA